MKFGEKLKQLRTNKGASQEETAKACGITRRTYICLLYTSDAADE